MVDISQKACSICGKSYSIQEFSYGNRDNRSYCQVCNKSDNLARSSGGIEAARQFREAQRAKWRREV